MNTSDVTLNGSNLKQFERPFSMPASMCFQIGDKSKPIVQLKHLRLYVLKHLLLFSAVPCLFSLLTF